MRLSGVLESVEFLVELIGVLLNWEFWLPVLVSAGSALLIYFYLPELIQKVAYIAFVIGIGAIVGYKFNGRLSTQQE